MGFCQLCLTPAPNKSKLNMITRTTTKFPLTWQAGQSPSQTRHLFHQIPVWLVCAGLDDPVTWIC